MNSPLFLLLLLLSSLSWASPAKPGTGDSLWLFEYQAPKSQDIGVIEGIERNGKFFLSLSDVFANLDFHLTGNSGWTYDMSNTFYFDINEEHIMIKKPGGAEVFQGAAIRQNNMLWLAIESLEFLTDSVITIDTQSQSIGISTKSPLLKDKLRNYSLRASETNEQLTSRSNFFVPDQYKLLDFPGIDISFSQKIAENSESNQSNLTGYAFFDFLKHSVNYSGSASRRENTSSSNQSIRVSKASTSRTNVPWKYEFGDISTSRSSYFNSLSQGKGISAQLGESVLSGILSDSVNVTGHTSPGWYAELFYSGTPIAFTQADSSGYYEFKNIQLYAGQNSLTIELYGPNGERNSISRPIWNPRGTMKKGAISSSFSHVKAGKLIDDDTDIDLLEDDILEASISYGLEKGVEISSGFISRKIRQTGSDDYQNEDIITTGLRLGGYFGDLDIQHVSSSLSGHINALQGSGQLHDLTYRLSYRDFSQFYQPWNKERRRVSSETTGSIGYHNAGPFSQILIRGSKRSYHLSDTEQDFSILTGWRTGRLNNSVIVDLKEGSTSSRDLTYRLSHSSGRLLHSFESKFSEDDSSLSYSESKYRLMYRHSLLNSIRFEVSDKHEFNDLDVLIAYDKMISDKTSLKLEAGENSTLGSYAKISVNFSIEASSSGLTTRKIGSASLARLTLKFFIDHNNDGIRDEDEEYFKPQDLAGKYTPSNDGLSFLVPASESSIQLKKFLPESAEFVPKYSSITVTPHPGSSISHEIPLVITTSLSGYATDAETGTPYSRALVSITADDGVPMKTYTDDAGYYYFDRIKPGRYTLFIEPINQPNRKRGSYIGIFSDAGFYELDYTF